MTPVLEVLAAADAERTELEVDVGGTGAQRDGGLE
jgi:hypothetical protein